MICHAIHSVICISNIYIYIYADQSFVGLVDKDQNTLVAEQREIFTSANAKVLEKKEKNRMRGRNKISAKLRRKQKNVIDAQTVKLKERQEKEREDREKLRQERTRGKGEPAYNPLGRFAKS